MGRKIDWRKTHLQKLVGCPFRNSSAAFAPFFCPSILTDYLNSLNWTGDSGDNKVGMWKIIRG